MEMTGNTIVRQPWLLALVVIPSLGGCATDGSAEADWSVSVETVDGTLRVVNTPPDDGVTPGLVATEELRVGTMDGGGPMSFGLIRSVAVLEDGRFAVADAQAEEVRLFDRYGQHVRTFGGEGAGPGELDGMQGVHVDREGMLRVAEQGNARLSIFHPDTGFVGSVPLRLFSYGFRGPWEATVDSAGRTLVMSSGRYGEDRFWNMLRIYDPSMTQVDSIPYYDYTDDVEREEFPGAWRITLGNGWTYAPVPFFAQPHVTLTPSGDFWTSTEGSPQLELTRWSPRGDTSVVMSSERVPEPVTPSERDSAMVALRENLAERMAGPPSLDASRVPATKPPVHDLSMDDRGRLWARVTDPAADTTVYDVFNDDGGYATTVSLPFRIDAWIPPVLRGDMLWGVVTDEVDVQYVVRARLRPAESNEGGPS